MVGACRLSFHEFLDYWKFWNVAISETIVIMRLHCNLTVGFLYGAGAETLIFVTGTSEKFPNIFVSQQKNQCQLCIPRKQEK